MLLLLDAVQSACICVLDWREDGLACGPCWTSSTPACLQDRLLERLLLCAGEPRLLLCAAAAPFADLVGGVYTFDCHKLPELHVVPLVHLCSNKAVKQPCSHPGCKLLGRRARIPTVSTRAAGMIIALEAAVLR
jgi:hypothetical protein